MACSSSCLLVCGQWLCLFDDTQRGRDRTCGHPQPATVPWLSAACCLALCLGPFGSLVAGLGRGLRGGRVAGTKNLNLWYSEMWKAGLFGQRKKGRIGKARKDIERSCDKTWAILTPRSAHLAMKNAGASIRIGRLGKYDAR